MQQAGIEPGIDIAIISVTLPTDNRYLKIGAVNGRHPNATQHGPLVRERRKISSGEKVPKRIYRGEGVDEYTDFSTLADRGY
jgi:hypothetical protein